MNTQDFIPIGGLLIAFVSLITGFLLQRDLRKMRDLERDNKKYRGRLMKALNAIKGYQLIEEEMAAKENMDTATTVETLERPTPNTLVRLF